MVVGMIPILYNKDRSSLTNSILISSLLISTTLMTACQPPSDNSQSAIVQADTSEKTINADLSFDIDGDTVTLSPDSIFNVKPSRYQPSLGLQGKIEPIEQSRFVTTKAVTVQEVLVENGQQVDKGSPLLILQYQPFNQNNVITTQTDTVKAKSSTDSTATNLAATNQGAKSEQDSSKLESNTNVITDTALLSNLNTDDKTKSLQSKEQTTTPVSSSPATVTITVRASNSGKVNQLSIAKGEQLKAGTALLTLGDDSHLQFIATLPIRAEPQISVGQSVNFTTQKNSKKYTGQVSKLSAGKSPNELKVYVQVLKNDVSREGGLQDNTEVIGRVDYGQIAVGTVVPEGAIHDANLTGLKKPPYQPLTPLSANVWIIKQDQRLTRQPIEIIKYDPITEQYLIAGVNNDSLICLANLPVESAGKKVIIS